MCEFSPMEAVRTNAKGTDNVIHATLDAGVKKLICLSTGKVAYPTNAMANARVAGDKTVICCTRYGNVMCSRGSVIPLFIDQIKVESAYTSHNIKILDVKEKVEKRLGTEYVQGALRG